MSLRTDINNNMFVRMYICVIIVTHLTKKAVRSKFSKMFLLVDLIAVVDIFLLLFVSWNC